MSEEKKEEKVEEKKEEKKDEKKDDKEGEDDEVKLHWPPLESDPAIFNEYFHSIGIKPEVYFKEILALVDYKEFLSIQGPLLGIILNYSRDENNKEETFPKAEKVPFFIKQTKELDNACGLIAALHCFGNAKNGEFEFVKDSILDEFFKSVKNKTPQEVAKLLDENEKFKQAHKCFSGKGQTNLKKEVKNDFVGHFICFMNMNGKLVEFDGIKEAPSIIKENIDDQSFIDETFNEILKRINNKSIYEQVNVMFVADDKTGLIDLLSD